MAKREARSVSSFEPYVPVFDGELHGELCLLCGAPIEPWPGQWCELIGPGERQTGWAHDRCISEYNEYSEQTPTAARLVTAAF